VDVASTPHWEFEFAMTDRHLPVRSLDPGAFVLRATADRETLELVVDGDLDVVETRRPD